MKIIFFMMGITVLVRRQINIVTAHISIALGLRFGKFNNVLYDIELQHYVGYIPLSLNNYKIE